jgi:hypothetical protein
VLDLGRTGCPLLISDSGGLWFLVIHEDCSPCDEVVDHC